MGAPVAPETLEVTPLHTKPIGRIKLKKSNIIIIRMDPLRARIKVITKKI